MNGQQKVGIFSLLTLGLLLVNPPSSMAQINTNDNFSIDPVEEDQDFNVTPGDDQDFNVTPDRDDAFDNNPYADEDEELEIEVYQEPEPAIGAPLEDAELELEEDEFGINDEGAFPVIPDTDRGAEGDELGLDNETTIDSPYTIDDPYSVDDQFDELNEQFDELETEPNERIRFTVPF